VLLALDLAVHRGGRATSRRAALVWSVLWVGAGVAFSAVIFLTEGSDGYEYLAAYAMEKSLSLDNLFVFLLIFRGLRIPDDRQHTVLTWGIFGALVLRAAFILAGVSALERWDWVRYVFGGLLIVAAIHAVRDRPDSTVAGPPAVVRWLSRRLPVSSDTGENRFFVRVGGALRATPLFIALVAIELTDVVFAIDSVPAALSVTHDRFIVYSSNAFAVLGLRSLYLAGHGYLDRLRYLHYGLSAVLAFAGAKLILGESLEIHALASVGIIVTSIGLAVLASLYARAEPEPGSERA
jgi:tellurite resistance protein TerC